MQLSSPELWMKQITPYIPQLFSYNFVLNVALEKWVLTYCNLEQAYTSENESAPSDADSRSTGQQILRLLWIL